LRKLLLLPLLLVLMGAMILGACAAPEPEPAPAPAPTPAPTPAPPAPEEPIELIYQAEHPRPQVLTQQAILPYVQALEEKSGGRLKITYYDKGGVVDAKGLMDGIASNTLQMGTVVCPLEPGRYPLTEVVSMPFVAPSSTIASLVSWHLAEKFNEWEAQFPGEVKMICHFVSAAFQIHMVDEPVLAVDDLKGKKMMTPNIGGVEVLKKAGAIPQHIYMHDAYEGLEKGMAEGILCPLAPLVPMKVSEVVKHHTIINMNYDMFALPINRSVFESMPADLQQLIISESGAKLAKAAGMALDEGAVHDCGIMVEGGATFYELPEAEMSKFVEMVMPIREAWVSDMEAKGLPAQAVLDEALSYSDQLVAEGEYVPQYPISK